MTNITQAPKDLEQVKKQAKELLRSVRLHDSSALLRVSKNHPEFAGQKPGTTPVPAFILADAQLVIARENGFASWPQLKHAAAQVSMSISNQALLSLEIGGLPKHILSLIHI